MSASCTDGLHAIAGDGVVTSEWSRFQFQSLPQWGSYDVAIHPGLRHWGIFTTLCRDAGARGNLIPDAWLAALAIESGCEFITTDRDYSRFTGLRWRHPLSRQT